MKTFPELIVCEHCDHVFRRVELTAHEVAHCEVCGAVLYRGCRPDAQHWFALTLATAIVFLIANAYPVLRIELQGLSNEVTLLQSFATLAHGAAAPIALPAAAAVIFLPLAQILLLAWLLAFARHGRRAPGFVTAMRAMALMRPWCMVEVCLLGLLVAVIKLSSQLTVVPGVGTWAMCALTLLLTLINSRDTRWLWDITEASAS